MKHIKTINESFQLIPKKILNTGNEKFFGEKPDASYINYVKEHIKRIAEEENSNVTNNQIKEKIGSEITMQMLKEEQQYEAIIHNCKYRNFRPQYTAEVVYHTIIQGRLQALAERPHYLGGIKESLSENENQEMIDGIIDLLKQVKDIDNRRAMVKKQLQNLKEEGIEVDDEEFLKACNLN